MTALPECPWCSSSAPYRHGRTGGLQRWRCRAEGCGKTYTALTGTPAVRIRKRAEWRRFDARRKAGFSVRTSASSLGLSKTTVHKWTTLLGPEEIAIAAPVRGNGERRFDFIDVFAGIGGFRMPFVWAGGRCVWSCEIDPHCRAVYQRNFGDKPKQDVMRYAGDAATDEMIRKRIPRHDVLLGGVPVSCLLNLWGYETEGNGEGGRVRCAGRPPCVRHR